MLRWGALLLVVGCIPDRAYPCAETKQCNLAGIGGECVDGFCAYPDASCESSELRFEPDAPVPLGGQCVDTGGTTMLASTTVSTTVSGETEAGSSTDPATTDPPPTTGIPCGELGQACCAPAECDDATAECWCTCSEHAQLVSGDDFACVLEASGDLYCWGESFGPVPVRIDTDHLPPIEEVQVRAHTCVLAGGDVYCRGENGMGQIGGPEPVVGMLTRVDFSFAVAHLAVGVAGTCAAAGSSVECNGDLEGLSEELVGPIDALAAGLDFACAVIDGGVHCWGRNNQGQVPGGSTADPNPPSADPIDFGRGVAIADVALGAQHACALSENEEVFCWGRSSRGQAGANGGIAVPPGEVDGTPARQLSTGSLMTCFTRVDDGVKCFGAEDLVLQHELDIKPVFLPQTITVDGNAAFRSVAVGRQHACVLAKNSGALHCWASTGVAQAPDVVGPNPAGMWHLGLIGPPDCAAG